MTNRPSPAADPDPTVAVLTFLVRADARSRWRSLAGLTLLVTGVVAAVLTSLATAGRTETAFDRYLDDVRSFDALMIAEGEPIAPEDVAATEGVDAAVGFHWYAAFPGDIETEFFPLIVPDDPRVPDTFLSSPVVAGRRPDPRQPLEVALGERTARRLGVTVGDPVPLTTFTQEGLSTDEPDGPVLTLEVVGIVRNPGDVAGREGDIDLDLLTPTFGRDFGDQVALFGTGVMLAVEPGATVDEVGQALQPLGSFEFDTFLSGPNLRNQVDPSLSSMAHGLRIVALVIALVGGTLVVLTLARAVADQFGDQSVLRALGVDRLTLFQRLCVPSALATGTGLLLGAGLSIALSPFTLTGIARRADVRGGVVVDPELLLPSLAVLTLALAGLVVLVAWVAMRRQAAGDVASGRPSTIATRAAGLGAPVVVVTGLRLAFERGRGRRATPVTAAMVASALGGIGVTAAIVFGSSLQHAVATPSVYGWGSDGVLSDSGDMDDDVMNPASVDSVRADPAFDVVAETVINLEITADGAPARATVLRDIEGHAPFVMASGSEPVGPGQVAVGRTTLEGLDAEIGDTVSLSAGGPARPLEIVGVAVLPVAGDGGSSWVGFALRGEAADAIGFSGSCASQDVACSRHLAVRAAPGVEVEAALAPHLSESVTFHPAQPPSEVDRLEVVADLPRLLSWVLAGLAVIAVVYASAVTVRRRRHDLAVLRVLGVSSRGLRQAVSTQVAALALVGSVIGVVLGVGLGRQLWDAVAEATSLPTVIEFPAVAVVLVPLAIAVLAQLGAVLSRHAAGRIPAAVALRVE